MAEETAFENGRISSFEGLMTLTLDHVILHTVMHHSTTFIYILHWNRRTFCGPYVRTDGQTFETSFIRL